MESWNPLAGSPLAVAGLKVWHDAAHVAGAGTAGYQVTDRTGRGHHGTQATTADQPQVVGGELIFAAGDFYNIATATLGLSGAAKAVLVFKIRSAESTPASFRRLFAAGSAISIAQSGATPNRLSIGFSDGSAFAVDNLFDLTQDHVVTIVRNGAAYSVRVDSAVIASGSLLTGAMPVVGANATLGEVGANTWNGAISAFLLVTGRIPSEPELQILEAAAAA